MKRSLLRGWRSYHQPPRLDLDADPFHAKMLASSGEWVKHVQDGLASQESILAREDLWWAYVELLEAEHDVFRWRTFFGFILLMLATVVGWAILTGGM